MIKELLFRSLVKDYKGGSEFENDILDRDRRNIEELKRSAPATGIKPAKKE